MKAISRQEAKEKGLTRYYTGLVCAHGHVDERSTHTKRCITCRKIGVLEWKKANPETVKARGRKYHADIRRHCVYSIGEHCACCGEDQYEFLTIDHTNGGGNKHRKSLGIKSGNGGYRFYKWLREEIIGIGIRAVRKEFRLLCWNCNAAYGMFGKCPHQEAAR